MNASLDPIPMTSRTVQVGKRQIFVSEAGDGYPVLMLHGGGPGASGASNYTRNIAALASRYRVIVPDLPGYGQSTKGFSRRDPFGDLASTMLGLMERLELPSAHIVGNSLGGACALRMALDQPGKVSSLILMGPGGINTTRALPTKGLTHLLNYYEGNGPSYEKMRIMIRDFLVYDGAAVPEDIVRQRYEATLDQELQAKKQLQRPSGFPDFRKWDFTRDSRLARCTVPTLVLWGIEDKVNRPNGGESLQRIMPNCDLYLFSKTGHWVQWERPEEFNAATLGFLSRVDNSTTTR